MKLERRGDQQQERKRNRNKATQQQKIRPASTTVLHNTPSSRRMSHTASIKIVKLNINGGDAGSDPTAPGDSHTDLTRGHTTHIRQSQWLHYLLQRRDIHARYGHSDEGRNTTCQCHQDIARMSDSSKIQRGVANKYLRPLRHSTTAGTRNFPQQ